MSIIKECEQCKKEFAARNDKIKKGQGKYCSRKCFGKSIAEKNGDYTP